VAFAVLLDTCTLHKPYLRDALLRLAEAGTYRPLWSHDILAELRKSLLARGFTEDKIDYLISEMRRAFEDAEVTGYEALIPAMNTPDPDDRHVLAAAVRSEAAAIVTDNVTDFPEESVGPYDIETLTPDDFLLNQLDLHETATLTVLEEQVADYQRPPTDVSALLDRLAAEGLAGFPDAALRARGGGR
jgi:predicted nucleic acid-binding protein